MAIYIRCYRNNCMELIFTEGRKNKKRIHILINPSEDIRLPTTASEDEAELNPQSITHILAMQTSIIHPEMLTRTTRIAEQTNLPIITNKKSAVFFKEAGLSVKQLRILGFTEEVIDGLSIDPVYKEELPEETLDLEKTEEEEEEIKEKEKPLKKFSKIGKKLGQQLNPIHLAKNLPKKEEKQEEVVIDATNPLAIIIGLSQKKSILFPLDKRGLKYLDKTIAAVKPYLVVIPEVNPSRSFSLSEIEKVVFIDPNYTAEEKMVIPTSHNQSMLHTTILGGYHKWYEVD
ncbi:MAG: hypothetical protein INQ03_03225 [Candidatus Heimdallarchaeota archaeon]|nr:hypothetical protein [Candidatus Heimdallarchaeota archaeon]